MTRLGIAKSTAFFATSGANRVDVPALTVTFVAPAKDVRLVAGIDLAQSTSVGEAVAFLVINEKVYGRIRIVGGTPASTWHTCHREEDIHDLVAGQIYTARLQLSAGTGGGTAYIAGDSTTPMYLRVETV